MGIIIPRPPIRRREERTIKERLARHAELMAQYIATGLSREAASRKAFDDLMARPRPATPGDPKSRRS